MILSLDKVLIPTFRYEKNPTKRIGLVQTGLTQHFIET
jgi:hypothetical protein